MLTSFAIVLGVAMISGTFVLTDTIRKSFDGIFDDAYESSSVVVSGKEVVEGSESRATVPAALVEQDPRAAAGRRRDRRRRRAA